VLIQFPVSTWHAVKAIGGIARVQTISLYNNYVQRFITPAGQAALQLGAA
jgi:hypothetical protein